ncbi:hypothetical protein Mal15_19550 [Stieleria maiorica]|uniref:Uncharacterized protein n=2 Tax=Stieleria maiorica TaxID=2795974 RepID=A0A5B9MBI9_9BACT|nr:hypothetical protein Mal15_19550 [Stieleria maiorica]
MAKYEPDSEGELYDDVGSIRAEDVNQELVSNVNEEGRGDECVSGFPEINIALLDAIKILRVFVDDRIEFSSERNCLLLDGKRFIPSSGSSGLVKDAFEVFETSKRVLDLVELQFNLAGAQSNEQIGKLLRLNLHRLVNDSFGLGRMHERMMQRATGIEKQYASAEERDRGLKRSRHTGKRIADDFFAEVAQSVLSENLGAQKKFIDTAILRELKKRGVDITKRSVTRYRQKLEKLNRENL